MKVLTVFIFALVIKILSARLIFEDTFSENEIDQSKWDFEQTLTGGGDWQFQWFAKDKKNAFVENGILHIRPTLTQDFLGKNSLDKNKIDIPSADCTSDINYGCSRKGTREHILNPIRSASIMSKVAFTYGTVEIRAKLPKGDWLRPFIKLQPKKNFYGTWPASGQIDLVEARGNAQLYDESFDPVGINRMTSTIHFGPSYDVNGWENTHYSKELSDGNFHDDFHIFQLEWNDKGLKFYVDKDEIGSVDIEREVGFWNIGGFEQYGNGKQNPWTKGSPMAPFDKDFYITIGLAVGGVSNFFSDDFENRPHAKPWRNESPKAPLSFWKARNKWYPTWTQSPDMADFQIDYVKVSSN